MSSTNSHAIEALKYGASRDPFNHVSQILEQVLPQLEVDWRMAQRAQNAIRANDEMNERMDAMLEVLEASKDVVESSSVDWDSAIYELGKALERFKRLEPIVSPSTPSTL